MSNAKVKAVSPHRLTNLDISNDYRDVEMWLMRGDFTGMFARWVVEQSPYEVPDFREALTQFNGYITEVMAGETCKLFTYDELSAVISDEQLEKIPAVLALNVAKIGSGPAFVDRHSKPHPDFDFIDLGALARNIFYSMVRSYINWAD